MTTTVKDVRTATQDAHRVGHQITAGLLTSPRHGCSKSRPRRRPSAAEHGIALPGMLIR